MLLIYPRTSGGPLVSCAPAVLDEVLALFKRGSFAHAAVTGNIARGPGNLAVDRVIGLK